jgi:hypothetical protein
MPARHRPNRLPPAPPPRRHSAHSPRVAPKESALEHVRRITRERRVQEKPFDPEKRGSWEGSSRDLVVNGMRNLEAIEFDLQDYGANMQHWHSSGGDPIYAVGSYAYSGKLYPKADVIYEAQGELERLERSGRFKGADLDELQDLIDQTGQLYELASGGMARNASHRRGDKHGVELIAGEGEGFIVIESEPNDRSPYILVNPLDFEMNNLYGLDFGYGTRILVWSRHLENALEPAAEWLAENAPGLIVSDDELNELFEEVKAEHPGISDEEAQEEATKDLTYTEAGYIGQDWGMSFDSEVASEEDPLFVTALEASKEEYAEVWPDSAVPER